MLRLRPHLHLALFGLAIAVVARAADPSPDEILKKALDIRRGVQDYTATVTLHADLPGVKTQDRTVKVYYKQPDKLHLESKQVAIIPKDALLFGNLEKHLDQAKITLVEHARGAGRDLYKLKLTRQDADQSAPYLLVSVNAANFTLSRIEAWGGGAQRMWFDFEHGLVRGKYWMPLRITCWLRRGPNTGHHFDPDDRHASSHPGGKFTVAFSDYQVNSGLSDSLFQDAK